MAGWEAWLRSDWFNLVQTVGICFGLVFPAIALNREAKARERDARAKEIENLLSIAEQQTNLWQAFLDIPEVDRVLDSEADLRQMPVSSRELLMVNLALLQYLKSWRISRAGGGLLSLEEIGDDIAGFLALPLPRAIWEKTAKNRNSEFIEFVHRAIERRGRLSDAGD